MDGESTNEQVDEDIEIFSEVVASLNDIATEAIDKGTEMGGDDGVVVKYVGTILKVTDPEVVSGITGPAFSDFG